MKEVIVTAKSLEDAIKQGAEKLSAPVDKVSSEILEETKKGFLGLGSAEFQVKITYAPDPVETAQYFLAKVLDNMHIENATINVVSANKEKILLNIDGENLGQIIGHHGEVLDALQYLVNLAANRQSKEKDYVRITVDVENYRKKREETLERLAVRVADRVKKNRRNMTLEPMNPYERRIIHSRIQSIPGVSTFSVGVGDERRVVVSCENARKASPDSKTKTTKEAAITPEKPKIEVDYSIPSYLDLSKKEVKAKSIDEINLADPDEGENFNE